MQTQSRQKTQGGEGEDGWAQSPTPSWLRSLCHLITTGRDKLVIFKGVSPER